MVWKKTHRRGAENTEQALHVGRDLSGFQKPDRSSGCYDLNPCNFML